MAGHSHGPSNQPIMTKTARLNSAKPLSTMALRGSKSSETAYDHSPLNTTMSIYPQARPLLMVGHSRGLSKQHIMTQATARLNSAKPLSTTVPEEAKDSTAMAN